MVEDYKPSNGSGKAKSVYGKQYQTPDIEEEIYKSIEEFEDLGEQLTKKESKEPKSVRDLFDAIHSPDPDYLKLVAKQLVETLIDKNNSYGNAFHTSGVVLELLYPYGIKPEQYQDALFLVRIWDKMKRIATDKDAFGESPYKDIAGYSILAYERYTFEECMKAGNDPFEDECEQ